MCVQMRILLFKRVFEIDFCLCFKLGFCFELASVFSEMTDSPDSEYVPTILRKYLDNCCHHQPKRYITHP